MVELRTVAPAVEGSNPSTHPKFSPTIVSRQGHSLQMQARFVLIALLLGGCVAGADYDAECHQLRCCQQFAL